MSVPYWPAMTVAPDTVPIAPDPAAMPVTDAPSAPGVSAPEAPLVVPTPVNTLPVSAVKLFAATASVSSRAVGTSSTTLIVRLPVAASPSPSVTTIVKTSGVPLSTLSVSM